MPSGPTYHAPVPRRVPGCQRFVDRGESVPLGPRCGAASAARRVNARVGIVPVGREDLVGMSSRSAGFGELIRPESPQGQQQGGARRGLAFDLQPVDQERGIATERRHPVDEIHFECAGSGPASRSGQTSSLRPSRSRAMAVFAIRAASRSFGSIRVFLEQPGERGLQLHRGPMARRPSRRQQHHEFARPRIGDRLGEDIRPVGAVVGEDRGDQGIVLVAIAEPCGECRRELVPDGPKELDPGRDEQRRLPEELPDHGTRRGRPSGHPPVVSRQCDRRPEGRVGRAARRFQRPPEQGDPLAPARDGGHRG